MQEKAKFVIELDLDNLEEIASKFKQLDIEFDTVGNMICLPQDMIEKVIFTGAEMGEILTAANKYLSENDDSHRLLEEFWQLTPVIRRDMMELLTFWADLQDGYDGKTVNDIEPDAWETFKEQHPEAVRPA